MTQVYTFPERKEIFADSIEDLQTKAEELEAEYFVAMTKPCKAMGTYRQTFIKQAETDQPFFPSVMDKEKEEEAEEEEGQNEPEEP